MNETMPVTTPPSVPVEEEETFYNYKHLTNIASWAKLLSWIVLVLGVVFLFAIIAVVVQIFPQFSSGTSPVQVLPSILTYVMYGFLCGFLFVILQAVAEGIYVLMDIEENTKKAIKA
jgi:hypothetical protein